MEKLYHILNFIFIHILFALVKTTFVVSLYVGAVDNDKSLLIITGLSVLAEQCLKHIYRVAKKDYEATMVTTEVRYDSGTDEY